MFPRHVQIAAVATITVIAIAATMAMWAAWPVWWLGAKCGWRLRGGL